MWHEILQAQCHSRGLAAVATQLGYSKATLSLVCAGKYGADTRGIEAAVLEQFGSFPCPYEESEITVDACNSWCRRTVPTSSSWALHHWFACQTCVNNTQPKETR